VASEVTVRILEFLSLEPSLARISNPGSTPRLSFRGNRAIFFHIRAGRPLILRPIVWRFMRAGGALTSIVSPGDMHINVGA